MNGKLIIFSAPSGSGKSTIINYLMQQGLGLAFSVSATSRAPRGTEQHGVEYFFLSPEEFRQRIANGEFLEYEEVYPDRFYGTLKAQVEQQQTRINELEQQSGKQQLTISNHEYFLERKGLTAEFEAPAHAQEHTHHHHP